MMYSSNEDLSKENTSQTNQNAENDDKKTTTDNDFENKPKDYQRKRRQRKKTDERQFVCDICDSSFVHSSNLRTHKRVVHAGIRPYACKLCDKSFPNAFALKRHSASHTSTVNVFVSFSKYAFFDRFLSIPCIEI